MPGTPNLYDEIVWGARFAPAFEIDEQGKLLLDVYRVSDLVETRRSKIGTLSG